MGIRLNLFGGFELQDSNGRAITLPTRHDRALLAYMALHGTQQWEREHLATLIWFDRGEDQARKSLRQSLVNLRRAVNGRHQTVSADGRTTLLFDDAAVETDFGQFTAAERDGSDEAIALACGLYRGELLQGLDLRSRSFADWLSTERMHFADRAYRLIGRLAEAMLAEGDGPRAEAHARRLVDIDKFREAGHRLLMRALAAQGRGSEALARHNQFAVWLEGELGVRPDPDTEAVRREVARRRVTAIVPTATPTQTLVQVPSPVVIVLPIRATDEGDDALTYGLTGELIAALATYRWFTVLSLMQSEVYRGRTIAPTALAAELGVRYIVDATLQRTGNRLRLHIALVHAENGTHFWSDRLECFVDEVFDVQDGLSRQITRLLEPELLAEEGRTAARLAPKHLAAWQLTVRAWQLSLVPDLAHNDRAIQLAREALALEPECAYANAALGWTSFMRLAFRFCGDETKQTLDTGLEAAERAVELDPRYFFGHATRGALQIRSGDLERALVNLHKAIDVNPSWPAAYNHLATCLTYIGRSREAFDHVQRLQRISPSDAYAGYYACARAAVHYFSDDDESAIESAQISIAQHPGWYRSMLLLVAACQRADRTGEAADIAADFHRLHGYPSRAELAEAFQLRRPVDRAKLMEPLVRAKLPCD